MDAATLTCVIPLHLKSRRCIPELPITVLNGACSQSAQHLAEVEFKKGTESASVTTEVYLRKD